MAANTTALRVVDDSDCWGDYFGPWLRELQAGTAARAGKPAKPDTLKTYKQAGATFHALLLELGRSTDPVEVTRQDIIAYAEWMTVKGYSVNTRHLWLTSLKAFFDFLQRVDKDHPPTPFVGISIPAAEMGAGEFPSDETIRKLLASCDAPREMASWLTMFLARRDEAIIRVFLDTGMRRGGLVSMFAEGVDLMSRKILVYWKGGKWVRRGIEPETVLALRRYRRQAVQHPQYPIKVAGGPDGAEVEPFWLSRQGPLSVSGLVDAHVGRCQEAGIEPFNLHQWRHRFGNELKRAESEGKTTTRAAMAMGGWESLSSYKRYGRAAEQEQMDLARENLTMSGRF